MTEHKPLFPLPKIEEGVLPPVFADVVYSVAERALALLSNRTEAELEGALEGLHVMLEEGEEEMGQRQDELEEQPTFARTLFRYSFPQLLQIYMEVFDITNQPDFARAHWSEYFALLALERYTVGVNTARQVLKDEGDYSDQAKLARLGRASMALMDATEAVAVGERLVREQNLIGDMRQYEETQENAQFRISLQRRVAARHRYAPLDQLKRDCVRFYRDTNPPSMAEGVRRFWRTVSDERKQELGLREPERVLGKILSQYKNGRLPKHLLP